MRCLKLITLTMLATLGAASTAHADCTAAYQEKLTSLKADYERWCEGEQLGMAVYGFTLVVPTVATAAITSTKRVQYKDREKVLNLITDAKQGNGLELVRIAENAGSVLKRTYSLESVAEVINDLNKASVFCRKEVLAYSEAEELILFNLKNTN